MTAHSTHPDSELVHKVDAEEECAREGRAVHVAGVEICLELVQDVLHARIELEAEAFIKLEVVCGLDAHIVFSEEKGPDMSSNFSSQENGRKHNSFFQKDIRAVFFPFINHIVARHKEITYICRRHFRDHIKIPKYEKDYPDPDCSNCAEQGLVRGECSECAAPL